MLIILAAARTGVGPCAAGSTFEPWTIYLVTLNFDLELLAVFTKVSV